MGAMLQLMQAQQEQQQRWLQAQREGQQKWLQAQQEGQAEQRQVMQLQMEALRSMLERVATRDAGETRRDRAGDMAEHVKLSRMSEADDVEAYLNHF